MSVKGMDRGGGADLDTERGGGLTRGEELARKRLGSGVEIKVGKGTSLCTVCMYKSTRYIAPTCGEPT